MVQASSDYFSGTLQVLIIAFTIAQTFAMYSLKPSISVTSAALASLSLVAVPVEVNNME